MKTVRTELINRYIAQLIPALGGVRKPPDAQELRAHFAHKRYAEMVRIIKEHLKLDMWLRVGFVKNNVGPKNAPAWILTPEGFPLYGTPEFKNLRVTMYIRNAFLAHAPFETVVIAIAHELTHVVLRAIAHPLRAEEEAVDLAAMILGYTDFYMQGCRYEERISEKITHSWWQKLLGRARVVPYKEIRLMRIGYLSPQEVYYATGLLKKHVPA